MYYLYVQLGTAEYCQYIYKMYVYTVYVLIIFYLLLLKWLLYIVWKGSKLKYLVCKQIIHFDNK
jgi:hypothetical protein